VEVENYSPRVFSQVQTTQVLKWWESCMSGWRSCISGWGSRTSWALHKDTLCCVPGSTRYLWHHSH